MASICVDPESTGESLNKFLDGNVAFGSWFDHVQGWMNAEDKERFLCISYEERITDLKSALTRVAQFMEKSLDSEVIDSIAEQCLFKNMKTNEMSNYSKAPEGLFDQSKSEFFRKGIIGDWKNLLTVAESEYFDSVFEDKMKDGNTEIADKEGGGKDEEC
ncbi:hypothetical protein NHX12_033119 [Muraenolepis orangiensis]|uniref:Sulfotransferase n=1 Tax=Muraenolepis orangiensis TaxID=630683 RepID=A0A9Q0IJC9_9TELE|nr:hypothetical protein NHX12_033119 [Muraenolepis orangiensis]